MSDDKNKTPPVQEGQTHSVTATDLTETAGALRNLDQLLGENPAMMPNKSVLLRFERGRLNPELLEALNMPGVKSLSSEVYGFQLQLVLGPFTEAQVQSLAKRGELQANDMVLESFGRWKPLRFVYPDLLPSFAAKEDVTETATIEGSFGSEISLLEMEALDELQSPVTPPVTSGGLKPLSPTTSFKGDPVPLEEFTRMNIPLLRPSDAKAASPAENKVATARGKESPKTEAATGKFSNLALALSIGGLALLAGFLYQRRLPVTDPLQKESKEKTDSAAASQNFPENLRPRSVDTLSAKDSSLVRKIRPILRSYELWGPMISQSDEQLLRVLSAPASASWEARRLAANRLAVFYLFGGNSTKALQTLNPIYELAPADAPTVLNLAIFNLVENHLTEASDLAKTGAALPAGGEVAWVAAAIGGMVEGNLGHAREVENNFERAINLSANNLIVYGMWIKSLLRLNKGAHAQVLALMKEAIFANPYPLLDSPIAAPLAGHFLVSEAMDGLKDGASDAEGRLTSAQLAYLNWLESRYLSFSTLSKAPAELVRQVGAENNSTSRLLYAQMLWDQGQAKEARDVMDALLPRLEKEGAVPRVSWPWTLAGDYYFAQGETDKSEESYRRAIRQNSHDAIATLGLGVLQREKGQYIPAEQSFASALQIDPGLIPARLFMDRRSWHRQLRSD